MKFDVLVYFGFLEASNGWNCWIFMKFDVLVYYGFLEASSGWNSPTLKSEMADSLPNFQSLNR